MVPSARALPAACSNLDVSGAAFRSEFEAILATIDQSVWPEEREGDRRRGAADPVRTRHRSARPAPRRSNAVLVRALLRPAQQPQRPRPAPLGLCLRGNDHDARRRSAPRRPESPPTPCSWITWWGAAGKSPPSDDVALADWIARRLELVSASTTQYGRVAAAAQATRRFWFEPVARRFTLRSPSGDGGHPGDPAGSSARRPPPLLPLATSRAIAEIRLRVRRLPPRARWSREFRGRALEDDRQAGVDPRPASQHRRGFEPRPWPIIAHLIQQPNARGSGRARLRPAPPPASASRAPSPSSSVPSRTRRRIAWPTTSRIRGVRPSSGRPRPGSTGNGPQAFETQQGVVFRLATRPGIELFRVGRPHRSAPGSLPTS
jgi:hypothetical protein